MLTETFALVLQLPPLVFGPSLPSQPFERPRALICPLRDLGRIQEPAQGFPATASLPTLDPQGLRPAPDRHLLNPLADSLMTMGLLASTGGTWDDRSWSTKRWEALGAVTPVLIPPQAPPVWRIGQR
jgi:hypothetical protein